MIMAKHNYEAFSFWALSKKDQRAVRSYVEHVDHAPLLDVNHIFKNANVLAASIAYYDEWVYTQVPALIYAAKTQAKKKALMGELYLVYYRYSSQYMRCKVEEQPHDLIDLNKKINDVAKLMNTLRASSLHKITPAAQLQAAVDNSSKCTQYCGLGVATAFMAVTEDGLNSESRNKVIADISLINERRLYWVWGGSMVRAILTYLPASLEQAPEALDVVSSVSPVAGSLSYILYFVRGALMWRGFLRHGLKGPWMNQMEYDLTLSDDARWKLYWEPAKYGIWNDTFWGPANLVCFLFYLKGGGLPFWADLLTAGLLIMDATFMLWKMQEEKHAHEEQLLRLRQEIEVLEDKCRKKGAKKEIYEAALHRLKEAEIQCQLEWKYKYMKVQLDLLYAASLLAAFVVLCAFFTPAGPAMVLLFAAIGSLLCFTLNLAYSIANMTVDLWKTKELKERAEAAGLTAEVAYQKQMLTYQTYQLIRSTVTDLLIPPLIIGCLVFLPLGIGIPALALGLALLAAVYFVSKSYEPSRDEPNELLPHGTYAPG